MIPLLWIALAHATTYTSIVDLDELVRASDAAVYGDVQELRTTNAGGMFWTIATVTPAGIGGNPVQVRYLGGCVDGICMTVPGAPRLEKGERVLVFLTDGQPTRFSDGVFHIRGDTAWADLAAVSLRDGRLPVIQAPLASLLEAAAELLPPRTNP